MIADELYNIDRFSSLYGRQWRTAHGWKPAVRDGNVNEISLFRVIVVANVPFQGKTY